MKKIEQKQLWKVTTDDFITSGEGPNARSVGNRQVKFKNGEIIEIRYPYAWHFRTEDSQYYHATEKMILDNCVLFGKIWDKVRSNGEAKLKDILRLNLYDGVKD